tara:strand:- start:710 stop:988 length:279 start_codon:yes stop_codon:yes gene_type:complete
MPIYEFYNIETGQMETHLLSYKDLDKFGKDNPHLERRISAPSFRLGGSGWYETDFKTGKKKNLVESEKKPLDNKKKEASPKKEVKSHSKKDT